MHMRVTAGLWNVGSKGHERPAGYLIRMLYKLTMKIIASCGVVMQNLMELIITVFMYMYCYQ